MLIVKYDTHSVSLATRLPYIYLACVFFAVAIMAVESDHICGVGEPPLHEKEMVALRGVRMLRHS